MAIGYNRMDHLHDIASDISIRRCTFINNTADAATNFAYSVMDVIIERNFNQRGAGMAIFFGEDDYYTGVIDIEGCEFTNNSARDSGGGVYMYLGGMEGSFQTITIANSNFTGNSAQNGGGGGLETVHDNANSVETPNYVRVTKCRFDRNQGNFGGGYKNIQLNGKANANYVTVQDTVFESNEARVGGGIYLQSVETVKRDTLQNRIILENWLAYSL